MNKRVALFVFGLLIATCSASMGGCSKTPESDPINQLVVKADTVRFSNKRASQSVAVTAGEQVTATVAAPADGWCTATVSNGFVNVSVDENLDSAMRNGAVTIKSGTLSTQLYVKQLGVDPDILLSVSTVDIPFYASRFDVTVTSNIDYTVSIAQSADWIKQTDPTRALMTESGFSFMSESNFTDANRTAVITVAQTGGLIRKELTVTQSNRVKGYTEGEIGDLGLGDQAITVLSGTASDWQSGADDIKQGKIEYSFDGDVSSLYHSRWGSDTSTSFPVTLTYSFNPATLDYIVYTPRKDSYTTGRFGQFELWLAEGSADNYVKYGDYDFKESANDSTIRIEPAKQNIYGAKFVVASGESHTVSCAEMTFYTKRAASDNGLESIFADNLYTTLKEGVGYEQIAAIGSEFFRNLAYAILDGVYDTASRVQQYQPYEPLEHLRSWMKTSYYNRYENPTGIYFPAATDIIVIAGNLGDRQVSLRVRDFAFGDESDVDYQLNEGVNQIKLSHKGLAYIAYFTSDFDSAPDVTIHIPSGKLNGCFDKNRHTDSDWTTMIQKTACDFFDIKGDYVNLCYMVSDLRSVCPRKGWELIDCYDQIVDLQWDIMGLKKYNRTPKNHMFGRRVKSGFFADGIGAGFDYSGLCDVDKILKDNSWGIAHEFGHVNQIRPGLKWVSTTEVTNNIYSICTRYVFDQEYMNLEMESLSDCEGHTYTGGRYGAFLNAALRDKQHWLTQRGPDNSADYRPGMSRDHFVKLIPLWQMLLYYRYMPDSEWYARDWYGNIAEKVRNSSWYDTASNGELQLKFMTNVMDEVKQDLTDFYIAVGMLTPIDEDAMDDYSVEPMKITQAMCDEVVEYAKRYPKPATPVLYYLSYFSRDAFARNLPVEGTFGQGVTASQEKIKVSTAEWKNVAAFEAYAGDRLKYISMVCSGDKTGNYTYAIYPSGCTRLEAVGVDGVRTLVYGSR